MAELDFPAGPSNGQTYTPSGSTITYTYTTAKGSWEGSLSGSQYTLQDKITLTATNTTDATHYPTFVNTATGDEEIRTDTGLTYNPSTGLLITTGITAALTGTFGVALGSDAEGDTYYRNSSGNFIRLAKGTDNHVMTMNGNVPNWEALSLLANVELKDFSETVNVLGSISGSTAIDYELGQVITATIGGATTFTFTNPPAAGKAGTFTLLVTNPTTNITWPGSVDWPGGTAPTLTTTGLDILTFITVDGGTIHHGMVAALDSK